MMGMLEREKKENDLPVSIKFALGRLSLIKFIAVQMMEYFTQTPLEFYCCVF
jgi:hypothetical protein